MCPQEHVQSAMVLNFRNESDLIKDAIKSQHNEVLACLALTWLMVALCSTVVDNVQVDFSRRYHSSAALSGVDRTIKYSNDMQQPSSRYCYRSLPLVECLDYPNCPIMPRHVIRRPVGCAPRDGIVLY
jgi:hypothetical protein